MHRKAAELRERLGYYQREVANKWGVSKQTVANCERGRTSKALAGSYLAFLQTLDPAPKRGKKRYIKSHNPEPNKKINRICLKCGKPFKHPTNRLCKLCNQVNSNILDI